MITMQQTFVEPEKAQVEDKLEHYREQLSSKFTAEGRQFSQSNKAFMIKEAHPLAEFIIPDFEINEVQVILTHSLRVSTRDQQRQAMLRGMYPGIKFVYIGRFDLNGILGNVSKIEEFIEDGFNPSIE